MDEAAGSGGFHSERRGVEQALVDQCSSTAYSLAKSTFAAAKSLGISIVGVDGGFANVINVGGVRIAITSDGIGTKAEVAERVGKYDTLGFDLVAMVADDLVAVGAEPFALSNVIDADRLDVAVVEAMMRGLASAASASGLVVTGGEIAALGRRVGGHGLGAHVNWCATALGLIPEGREAISGQSVRAGDVVVALQNEGLRSNGLTLARSILETAFGTSWHEAPNAGRAWGERLLTPSVVYAPAVCELLRSGVPIHGVAHVTGGGIPANLGRILVGRGVGAVLDGLFPPDAWVAELARLGSVSPFEAYGQWNMGNGMLLVLPGCDADRAVSALASARVASRVAGNIVQGGEIAVDARAWGMGVVRYRVE